MLTARQKVLTYLTKTRTASAREISRSLKMSPATVRHHNKARKLEYDLAGVVRQGCDLLVTVGGTQTNHAVMTAAAARRLGLGVKLVLGGPDFTRFDGNLLLDVVYGAEIRYLVDNDDNDSLAAAMADWVQELRAAGRRPVAVPLGGSTGAGALGYVRAARELAGQIGDGPVQIVTAVGSCGTFAGLNLGARLFLPRARVVGISVSRTASEIKRLMREVLDHYLEQRGVETRRVVQDLQALDGRREQEDDHRD